MTALMFRDAFWGADFSCHAGYDAVIHRLQDGRQMCKDVEELLKMRALAEEKYGKELLSISCKAGGHTEISTLRASFDQLKSQLENIGNFHIQLSDTLKEEVKKLEVFRERQREQRKKFQSIMEKVQRKKVSLYKKAMESKKNYQQRWKEADEVERTAKKATLTAKHSDKIRHRAKQCRKNANEAEKLHSTTIMELAKVREDWEETHRSTCEVFQQMEADRIVILRCALWDHCNHLSVQCVRDDQKKSSTKKRCADGAPGGETEYCRSHRLPAACPLSSMLSYEEVRKQLETCDIITDINCFIRMKSTGTKPPEPLLFESSTSDIHQTPADSEDLTRFETSTLEIGPLENNTALNSTLRSSDHQSTDSLHIPESAPLNDTGGSDGGYAPLPCPSSAAGLSADEERYTVLFEYTAQEYDELSVSRGESVQVLERGGDGWWMVEKDGTTGLVPGNYLGKM